jgi:hypothetical protein
MHASPFTDTLLLLTAIKVITVILGVILVSYGVRAFTRTRLRSVFWLTAALAAMTTGAIVEGVLHRVIHSPPEQARLVAAAFTFTGFALFVLACYIPQRASAGYPAAVQVRRDEAR